MFFRSIMATTAFLALSLAAPTSSDVQLAKRAEGIHLTNCAAASSLHLPPLSLVLVSLLESAQPTTSSHSLHPSTAPTTAPATIPATITYAICPSTKVVCSTTGKATP
jgi:hypothetical protein